MLTRSNAILSASVVGVVSCALAPQAYAIDSFFDVFVELSDSGNVVMVPVDSAGEFPFPPPPLDFPDLPTSVGSFDTEMVSMSLTGSPRMPMTVGAPDPATGQFQVDSFFDVFYEIDVTDQSGTTTHIVDSFFDVEVNMEMTPGPVEILPQSERRTFQTEILSMSLSGDIFGDPDFDLAIAMREGHAGKSDGHVTVLKGPGPGGGEEFIIDSFFDVFVELSVDGGPPIASEQNSQLRFASHNVVPEPTSLALVGLGGLALIRRRR